MNTWLWSSACVVTALALTACGDTGVFGSGGSGANGSGANGAGGNGAGGSGAGAGGGQAGQGTGGDAGGGGDAGSGGVSARCVELADEYRTALERAKACNPSIDVEQCTEKVDDQLPCPCPTFINPNNTQAVAALEEAKEAWVAQGCGDDVACPAIACLEPKGAICTPKANSGSCVDGPPE